jgi:hypothetical protein
MKVWNTNELSNMEPKAYLYNTNYAFHSFQ